jgi:hypothetical protein
VQIVAAVIALVLLLAVLTYLRGARRGGVWRYWPWLDTNRGDRRLEAYVAEEEIKRTASPRDRDVAP